MDAAAFGFSAANHTMDEEPFVDSVGFPDATLFDYLNPVKWSTNRAG